MGLVGPNGAGKTTLIKILATLVQPDAGVVNIAGYDVRQAQRKVREIVGYLSDVPGLYQDMRVVEFLEFFADAYHVRGPRKAVVIEQALRIGGLTDRRKEFVEQLSLGFKQRLLLAKTLLHEPKVLLLDEPATGLDPLARIELRELLKQFNRNGGTILVSSHILSDLQDICDRVALIAAGRNAADPEGHSILVLNGQTGERITCEVEVLGEAQEASQAACAFAGVKILDRQGQSFLIEVAGGPAQVAALLRHLVGSGISVLRFDTRRSALEDRYRRAFGEGRR